MKPIVIAFALFLTAAPAFAQKLTKADFLKARRFETEARFRDQFKDKVMLAAHVTCFAGATADIISSRGGPELNPVLRNSAGTISVPKAAVGYAVCGLSMLVYRWNPRAARILSFISGSAHFAAAIHNVRMN